jgi:hypothetical protein
MTRLSVPATATLIALATCSTLWFATRWLGRREQLPPAEVRKPLESWENEGGALAPHQVPVETSQVPR